MESISTPRLSQTAEMASLQDIKKDTDLSAVILECFFKIAFEGNVFVLALSNEVRSVGRWPPRWYFWPIE